MKKAYILSLTVLAIFSFLLFSCDVNNRTIRGNGEITEVEYDVDSFNAIRLDGSFMCHLVPSDVAGVRIETDENFLDYIDVSLDGSELRILTEDYLKSDHGVHVYLMVKELKSISSSSVVAIDTESAIKADKLEVSVGGAGKIHLQLDVEEINIDFGGAGLLQLEGTAKQMNVTLSGAGSLEAADLVAANARIILSGVGSAEVNVIEELDATVSGIGVVSYHGEPKNITKTIAGLGKVKPKN